VTEELQTGEDEKIQRKDTKKRRSRRKRKERSFTSIQHGGGPQLDGRPVSGGGVSDHLEDVAAAGVQRLQLHVGHVGVADGLHLQRGVSARHL